MKILNKNLKSVISFLLITLSLFSYGATNSERLTTKDYALIGSPASTNDKGIIVEDGTGTKAYLKANFTTQKFQQSFDNGSTFKSLGSGAGGSGGINFMADINSDAEGGTTNWTNSGSGTFTTLTSGQFYGLASFSFDGSTTNDKVTSDQVAIPAGFFTTPCEASFYYKGGTASLVKAEVIDGASVVLATYTQSDGTTEFLEAETSWVKKSIYFLCPGSGTVALRFNQTAAGDPAVLYFDNVHLGQLTGLSYSAQLDTGWVQYTPTTAGLGTLTNSSFWWRRNGPDMFIRGSATTGTVTAAAMTISVPSGYAIDISEMSASTRNLFGLMVRMNSTTAIFPNNKGLIPFSDGTDTANIFFARDTASATALTKDLGSTIFVSGDSFAFFAQVPIAEFSAVPQLVYNSIPTKAQNENTFSSIITNSGAAAISSQNATFISSVNRTGTGIVDVTWSAGVFTLTPSLSCSPQNAGTVGCKITSVSSSSATIFTFNDTTGAGFDDDFHLYASKQGADYKLPIVQPILVNQVETGYQLGVKTESCAITNTGTPTANSGLCSNWVSSLTDNAVGDVTVNFVANTWPVVPICQFTGLDASMAVPVAQAQSTSSVRVITYNNVPAAADRGFVITCFGARQ